MLDLLQADVNANRSSGHAGVSPVFTAFADIAPDRHATHDDDHEIVGIRGEPKPPGRGTCFLAGAATVLPPPL